VESEQEQYAVADAVNEDYRSPCPKSGVGRFEIVIDRGKWTSSESCFLREV
jgi:hypothetical protein